MNLLLLFLGSVVILTASDWVNLIVNGEAIAEPEALAEAYPKRSPARTTKRLTVRKPAHRSTPRAILGAVAPSVNVPRLTVRKNMPQTTIRRTGQRRTAPGRRGSRRTTERVITTTYRQTTRSPIGGSFGGFISQYPINPKNSPTLETTPLPIGDHTLKPDHTLHSDLVTTPRPISMFRSALENIALSLKNTGLDVLGRSVDSATRVISDRIQYSSGGLYGGNLYPGAGYSDPNFNLGTVSPTNFDPYSEFTTSSSSNLDLSLYSGDSTPQPDPNLEIFNISALLEKADQGNGEEALRELLQQIQVKVNELKDKISNRDASMGLEQEKINTLEGILNTIQENLNKASEISNSSSTKEEMSTETTLETEGTETTTQLDYGDFLDI